MKVSYFIKLACLVTTLCLLPWHASYAGCGCEEGGYKQNQDESDIENADPSRD